jgi:hypothetical protein
MLSVKNRIISASTAIVVLFMTSGMPQAVAAPGANSIQIIPTITSVALVGDVLTATGTATATINGKTKTVPFTSPVDITLAPNQPPGAICPVLDLSLGPINLDILGLVVRTSPICLTITAVQGGGLLGDLLCSLGQALQNGLTLPEAIAISPDPDALLAGITDLINGALSHLYEATLTVINPGGRHHTCSILHLELGPLDLNLLGLDVVLDNCSGGAITIDIRGVTGRGLLLGNLLCELLGGNVINLGETLQEIIDQILGLLSE